MSHEIKERRSSIDETAQIFTDGNLVPPDNLSDIREKALEFVRQESKEGRPVVLVTSGGTTVPLEHNTVRFVDNFSAGTRGSSSTEYFLEAGYSVIFLYRSKTLEPYLRHFSIRSLLEGISITQNDSLTLSFQESDQAKLVSVLKAWQRNRSHLHTIQFTTLAEYLHILRELTCQVLNPLGSKAMLYLAAAVSDFYIPSANMQKHKIQSNQGPLSLHLELVPKLLRPLVRHWCPNAFVISFKLETDESILLEKARVALKKYGHKLVIANILQTRKHRVVLVEEFEDEDVCIKDEDEIEIESVIVTKVVEKHKAFMS